MKKNTEKLSILFVEDETKMREVLSAFFAQKGYHNMTAGSIEEAKKILNAEHVHLVISDIRLSPRKEDGLDLLRWIQKEKKGLPVILVTAYGRVRSAVQAVREGAYDYIEKPFDLEQLLVVAERALENVRLRLELEKLKASLAHKEPILVGKSKVMEDLHSTILRVGTTVANVLITGESGTGKELVARAIHEASENALRPFLGMNCAAFPENLLESELFGYKKGAFTDARSDKPGLLKAVGRGLLFLDEIAEMPFSLQSKLLRVIEAREFYPLGSTHPSRLEARIVSATNKDLQTCVQAGRFREDLFFRLKVIHLHLPPLRERTEDIPLLVQHFLNLFNEKYHKEVRMGKKMIQSLLHYSFPGNVRELSNIVEAYVAMAGEKEEIIQEQLPSFARSTMPRFQKLTQKPFNEAKKELNQRFIKEYFSRLLKETKGNISEAARRAGIHRKQLQRYLKAIKDAT